MKKFATLVITCCLCGLTSLFAQNIQEVKLDASTNGDTIEAPGAGTYIFDDGGNGGSYSGGHDYHLVIRSTCDTLDTVNHMCVVFAYYDIACTDTLYIYDGKNTSAPVLLKINNCYASAPGNRFFISKTNTTGMLTLRLRSTPGSSKPAGFSLHVECEKPCENVTAHIANYYDRTDKYGNILRRDYLKPLPESLDTIWYYPPGDTVNHTDSIIRIDTVSWIDGALICDGQGIIFHGYGEYTHLSGYYNPHDSTTMFYWTFGTQDTLAQRNATAPLYTRYKEVGCYDVLLSLTDERGCSSLVSPHIQVRLAKNPIKTIFDLAPICNNEFLTVNVGYDGQGTLTLKRNKFQQVKSKTNNVRTFIPDGPRCSVRCYWAPVTFNEFPNGRSVTSAGDICSVCVNYEHSFMGDYSLALLCPTYDAAQSPTRGRAVLKYKEASQVPSGQTIPPGTVQGGGTFTGGPWNAPNDGNGDHLNGDDCDSAQNPFGIGYNYCFSRNGDYILVSGEPADTPNPQAAGIASSGHTSSVTYTFPPVPAGFVNAGTSIGQRTWTCKDSSDHDNKTGYYIPADDFTTLVGCPLNGTWQVEICDYWGVDNGWVFSWTLDICGLSAGGGCEYQVGVDSVVWRPDTNYATDFRDGRYVGLQIHPTDSVNSDITSPDTAGDFTIILSVYDEFGCQWDTVTHITSVYTPRPNLGRDTLLCGVASTKLNASDKFAKHANYRYTWAPFGETDSVINTHTNTNADITYVVEVDNYQSNKHCVSRDTIRVAVNDQPIANFDPGVYPLEGCEPLTVRINNTSKYGFKYRWVFGDGTISTQKNPTHSYAAGQYDFKYYVESEKGCKDSLVYDKLITVFPNPQASFSWEPVYPTVMHPSIQLENRTTPNDGSNKYFWEVQYDRNNPHSFDTKVEENPTFEWTAKDGEDVSGSYTVRLIARTDNRGPSGRLVQCADTVENTILLINDFLQFPTVVTPNGDGINDRFVIKNLIEGLGYPINQLDIYDKWGSRVFHATNITQDDQFWDPAATNTPTGTYFYRFSGKGYNGNIERNGVIEILK